MLSIREIRDRIPHRYPFLLVDKVVELEVGIRAVGIKNVTVNEPFFMGHYPDYPIMPGVLIVEAMAQVGGLALSDTTRAGKVPLLAGIDGARFRKSVVPGDQLRIEVQVLRFKGNIGKIAAHAFVDSEKVAEAELLFAMADPTAL